jgi:glyoxylase I family protein
VLSAMTDERRLRIAGIHHITLISADLERATAFYRDLLGLRLVEAGVNQDDPGARHFWFGDADGAPGTLVTLFEYPEMERGTVGVGATHHFAFRVSGEDELEGWRRYLDSRGVPCTPVLDRDRFKSIYLRDPDGHIVEIATDSEGLTPSADEPGV